VTRGIFNLPAVSATASSSKAAIRSNHGEESRLYLPPALVRRGKGASGITPRVTTDKLAAAATDAGRYAATAPLRAQPSSSQGALFEPSTGSSLFATGGPPLFSDDEEDDLPNEGDAEFALLSQKEQNRIRALAAKRAKQKGGARSTHRRKHKGRRNTRSKPEIKSAVRSVKRRTITNKAKAKRLTRNG